MMAIAKAKKDNIILTQEEIIRMNIKIYDDVNIDIKYKDINLLETKILVLSLLKDPMGSYPFINHFIKQITNYLPKTKFSFLTNNNSSIGNVFIDQLLVENKNIQLIRYKDEHIDTNNRIHKFAEYRNLNFEYAIKTIGMDFDYVIVFDSDLASYIPVEGIIKSISLDTSWSCVSANCPYANTNLYYDELALRLPGDPKDISYIHPKFKDYYGVNQKWLEYFRIFNNWTRVDSAFGCLAIYKMKELLEIYNKYGCIYDVKNYPPYTAEHISLHYKLSDKQLISPFINHSNKVQIEDNMINMPTAFVPRDAGFFSVFNFYIGTLTQGLKSYPLWNRNELLNIHRTNDHFAYWTENYNCWFDYFEPVKFWPDDSIHTTDAYLKLPRYSGEQGPDEFRLPAVTKELLKGDKEKFKQWRTNVHQFFKTFVKFKPEIVDNVDNIWSNNFSNSQNIIGVHYRHPSHFIESGKIYLEDYFNKADEILHQYPDSKIFLASDSQFGIYSFQERYKDKIYYIEDIDRLSMAEFLHWAFGLSDGKADHVGFINGKGYELHHKRVGKTDNKKMTIDLLKEVLCLSRCNQIINNISNIPLAISYINPDVEIITL
jgi:hypothetical protein